MDKTISYLESRVWYRALKVLYIIFFCLIFLYWLAFLAILLPLIGSMLDFAVLYFLILWIADLIRRRGGIERSENKKVKLVINIIFASIFLLMIIALILNSFKSY